MFEKVKNVIIDKIIGRKHFKIERGTVLHAVLLHF